MLSNTWVSLELRLGARMAGEKTGLKDKVASSTIPGLRHDGYRMRCLS